jgi:alkylation response protein AidB-like acyl-CoA dehydrogenase
MDFNLTEEQQQLSDAMQRFVAKEYGVEKRKQIMKSPEGFSREVWRQLGELGFLALQVPEEHGGMGAGATEMMLMMNAIGKGLLLEPYLPSAILGAALLRELGSAEQKESILSKLATGELIVVPAHTEPGARYDLARVAAKAVASGGEYLITGKKAAVVHAPSADFLIVSARTSGAVDSPEGISLFLVPRDAPGLSLHGYATMDSQHAADVTLNGVRAHLLGPEGGALPVLSKVFDLGVAALCAEAVGALQASLDATIEYTKTRQQFGQPIGKFQALQHRMAEMFMHVEQARSMSYLAAMSCGESDSLKRRHAISAAKVLIGQASRYVSQQSIQLHGGMGMTDELLISHHFRRLTSIELSLGDTEHHLEQFVRIGDRA